MNKSPLLLFPTHYLGNFALGLPWVCEVSRQYPDAVVVIDSRFLPLLEEARLPRKNIILYPRAELSKGRSLFTRAKKYIELIRQLRHCRDYCLVDMEGERFSGLLSLLSGCSTRIGPKEKFASWFYTSAHKLNYEKHRFNSFGEIIGKWQSVNAPSNTLNYKNDAAAEKSIRFKLGKGKSTLKLIVMHAGASATYKRWPVAHFSKLKAMLNSEGYRVVWIGAGHSDSRIVDEIESIGSRGTSTNLCGQLSYQELIALFRVASMFIGADSGPMHLAASTGLPLIGLFGPSNENIWQPLGKNSSILRGKFACEQSCEGRSCQKDERCLETLDPQIVFNTIVTTTSISISQAIRNETKNTCQCLHNHAQ